MRIYYKTYQLKTIFNAISSERVIISVTIVRYLDMCYLMLHLSAYEKKKLLTTMRVLMYYKSFMTFSYGGYFNQTD